MKGYALVNRFCYLLLIVSHFLLECLEERLTGELGLQLGEALGRKGVHNNIIAFY